MTANFEGYDIENEDAPAVINIVAPTIINVNAPAIVDAEAPAIDDNITNRGGRPKGPTIESVTSEILRDALRKIDTIHTFNRTEATPFLLLDVHGSCFQLLFLDHITAEETKWTVCVGVPYGMHVWQVGDSSKQNGAFKKAITMAKQSILEKKCACTLKGQTLSAMA